MNNTSKEKNKMSPAPTRRLALLGTASIALISGLGGVLLPNSAFACHSYKSKSDGKTGCAAYKRDQAGGASSGASSKTASKPQTTSTASSDTQESSGDPEVSGRTIRVSNSSQFQSALASAAPGNRIELANSTYKGNFVITKSGTKSAPILIEAANPLEAVITSGLEIRGNHVIVSGVTFQSRQISVLAANCRITRCLVERGAEISARGASDVEIDYNELRGWSFKAIDVDPYHENRTGYGAHIHHNYCHSGKGHAIGIGQQIKHHSRPAAARVHHNLIENVKDGGIHLKSAKNQVYANTLINGEAIAVRHGPDNTLSDNWLENSLSLIVRDLNCIAKGNKLVGCRHGLLVFGGNLSSAQVAGSRLSASYPFAENCQLIDNDANLTAIGRTYSSFKPRLPATNTIVSGHKGPIRYETDRNTRVTSTSQSKSGGNARKLSPGQVGPRGRG